MWDDNASSKNHGLLKNKCTVPGMRNLLLSFCSESSRRLPQTI